LAHVVEAAQAGGGAGNRARVRRYEALVAGLGEDRVLALARHAGGADGLEGWVVDEVAAFVAEDVSVFRLDGYACRLVQAVVVWSRGVEDTHRMRGSCCASLHSRSRSDIVGTDMWSCSLYSSHCCSCVCSH
jgi:hypothetical protein